MVLNELGLAVCVCQVLASARPRLAQTSTAEAPANLSGCELKAAAPSGVHICGNIDTHLTRLKYMSVSLVTHFVVVAVLLSLDKFAYLEGDTSDR